MNNTNSLPKPRKLPREISTDAHRASASIATQRIWEKKHTEMYLWGALCLRKGEEARAENVTITEQLADVLRVVSSLELQRHELRTEAQRTATQAATARSEGFGYGYDQGYEDGMQLGMTQMHFTLTGKDNAK